MATLPLAMVRVRLFWFYSDSFQIIPRRPTERWARGVLFWFAFGQETLHSCLPKFHYQLQHIRCLIAHTVFLCRSFILRPSSAHVFVLGLPQPPTPEAPSGTLRQWGNYSMLHSFRLLPLWRPIVLISMFKSITSSSHVGVTVYACGFYFLLPRAL